jgi:mxaJ protein
MLLTLPPNRRFTLCVLLATLVVGLCGITANRTRVDATLRPALRVCAHPNNLPFSNMRGQGFENALATMVATDLGRTVQYTWWAEPHGFVGNTLKAGQCDVVMGVPASFRNAVTTRPYYRSTYVWVSRRDRRLNVRSFDDPRLHHLSVGLHLIGDDGANVPPAQARATRGVIANVRGYSIYGDSTPNPPAAVISAVARGDVDLAMVWGPLAGYFAPRQDVPLDVVPVSHRRDGGSALAMVYDIAMGVRREDTGLRADLDAVIARRQAAITRLLQAHGVPVVSRMAGKQSH